VFLESLNSTAMQLTGSKFQSSITLFENAYLLTFSLNLFLNSFWSCPLLLPSSSWKNNSGLISYFLLTILKVSIRSPLILRSSNRCKPNIFGLRHSSECVHCVGFRWPKPTILGTFWHLELLYRPPFTDEGQIWCRADLRCTLTCQILSRSVYSVALWRRKP